MDGPVRGPSLTVRRWGTRKMTTEPVDVTSVLCHVTIFCTLSPSVKKKNQQNSTTHIFTSVKTSNLDLVRASIANLT